MEPKTYEVLADCNFRLPLVGNRRPFAEDRHSGSTRGPCTGPAELEGVVEHSEDIRLKVQD